MLEFMSISGTIKRALFFQFFSFLDDLGNFKRFEPNKFDSTYVNM